MRNHGKTFLPLILGMLFCSMLFTGCEKDDDDKETPSEIIGEWQLEAMEIGVLRTTDEDLEEVAKEVFKELGKEFYYGEVIVLNEDGTGKFRGEPMEYSVNKYTLLMTYSDGYELKFSFVVFDEKLILTLNMKEIILNEMTDDLNNEEIAYLKQNLQEFTIDFTFKRK